MRLAECLARGVDPWQQAAVVVRWKTLSLSLPEAVLMAKEALGQDELRRRMSLIGRYTSVASTLQQKQIALDLIESAVNAQAPMSDLTLWKNLSGSLSNQQTMGLVQHCLSASLEQGGEWGADLLGWTHRRVLEWSQWPTSEVGGIESNEDPHVRDAYWALVRGAAAPRKPSRIGGMG